MPTPLENFRSKVQEWQDICDTIQKIPGFEMFLKPKPASYYMSGLPEGPVVVINVHKIQSDALILHEGRILHLRLPDLHLSDVEKWQSLWKLGFQNVRSVRFPTLKQVMNTIKTLLPLNTGGNTHDPTPQSIDQPSPPMGGFALAQ